MPDSSLSFLFALVDSVKPGKRGAAPGYARLAARAGVSASTAHAACRHLVAAGYVRELREVNGRARLQSAAPRGSGRHVALSGWQVDRLREAFADRRLSGWDLRVLLAVIDRRGEDGPGAACGLTRDALADLLGTAPSRVSRAVAALAAAGLLGVEQHPGRQWILTPHHAVIDAHPRPAAVRKAMAHARKRAGVPRDLAAAVAAEEWRSGRRRERRYPPTPAQAARWAADRGRKPNDDRGRKPNGAGTPPTAFPEVNDTNPVGTSPDSSRGSTENTFMVSRGHLASVANLADRQPFSARPPEPPPPPQPVRRRPPPLRPEERDEMPGWLRSMVARNAPGVLPPGDPLFGLGAAGVGEGGIPPGDGGLPPDGGNAGD